MKWTTKDGVTSDIRDLETSHLKNILAMLKRKHGEVVDYFGEVDGEMFHDCEEIDYSDEIIDVQNELLKRLS